jgi:hypothetical protein
MKEVGFSYVTVAVTVIIHTRLSDTPQGTPRQLHAELTQDQRDLMLKHLIENYGFVESVKDA